MAKDGQDTSNDDTGASEEEEFNDLFQKEVDSDKGGLKLEESDQDDLDTETDEDSEEEENADSETEDTPKDDPASDDVNWEDRYKNLQSHTDKQVNTVKAENQELRERLDNLEASSKTESDENDAGEEAKAFDPVDFLGQIPEDKQALFKDNPELLEVIPDIVKTIVGSTKSVDIEAKVAELVEAQLQERTDANLDEQAKVEDQKVWDDLVKAMPEAQEIYDSPMFTAWYEANVDFAQGIASSANGRMEGVQKVLTYYQSKIAMDEDSKSRKGAMLKSTSSSPKGKSKKPTSKANEDDYEGSFAQFEQEEMG